MTTDVGRAAGRHEFVVGGAVACGTTFPEDHGALAFPRTVVADGFEGRGLAGRPGREALGGVGARARTNRSGSGSRSPARRGGQGGGHEHRGDGARGRRALRGAGRR